MISSPREVNYPDQTCRRLGGLTIASKDIVPEYRVIIFISPVGSAAF